MCAPGSALTIPNDLERREQACIADFRAVDTGMPLLRFILKLRNAGKKIFAII
jgi:hypothetical protein